MKLGLIVIALAASSVSGFKLRQSAYTMRSSVADGDVDCAVGDWAAWGECSKPCGGGQKTRSRTALSQPAGDGAACPVLTETVDCNTQECPVDCVVSDWSQSGECTATCGGGIQLFTRSVTTKNAFGGKVCPELTKQEPCGSDACPVPVDCVVSEWSSYGECSAKCGGGTMTRTRTVTTPAANDGAACPGPLEETTSCNWYPCAVDCVVSDFGPWGECSAQCDGGIQKRSRTATQKPLYHGASCPGLEESQACNTQGCVVDCKFSEWGAWGACNASRKQKQRRRTIAAQPRNGGKACPNADSKDFYEIAAC